MSENQIIKLGKGAFRDRPDARDYPLRDVCGAVLIDWDTGYDVEKALGVNLKVEHQNGSLSCVAQAWTKYTEVLDLVETGRMPDHSAKSIYEQIYLPEGGAYLRDGAQAIVKGGVALESWIPSYDSNGNPPLEEFMRKQTITPELRKKMKVYQAKEYRSIGSADVDLIAWAIQNSYGAVTAADGDNAGWVDGIIKNPVKREWGHAFYFTAFGKDGHGRFLKFINSWGTKWGFNGWGIIYVDEFNISQHLYGAWTLIDKPNVQVLPDPKLMALLNKKKNKIFFNAETGNFGLSVGDQLLELKEPTRAGLMALMAMVRDSGVTLKNEDWLKLPKKPF